MSNNTAANIEEFDELEAMLQDMQDDVISDVEEAESTIEDIDLDELSDDLDEAETVESSIELKVPLKKQEAAVEAELLDDIEEDAVEAEKLEPEKEKVEPKKTKAKKTSSPRFDKAASLVECGKLLFNDSNPFLLVADDADETADEVTESNLERLDGVKPVKVREKLANAMAFLAQGKTLSRYTRAALELALSKEEFTKADVTNQLLDQGVAMGTASSQSGQMTHVLTCLKVAEFKGGKFVTNPDSILLSMISLPAEVEGDSEEVKAA